MRHDLVIAAAKETAHNLKSKGFRVWLAKSGTYGIFSDENGQRVVYFQEDLAGTSFTGCYKPNPEGGSGWGIVSNISAAKHTREQLENILYATAPSWAMRNSAPQYLTVEQYLKNNTHSNYQEV